MPTTVLEQPRSTSKRSSQRWQHWQQSPATQKYLPAEAQHHGYVVVWVPPICREVFLDILILFMAYHKWHTRKCPPQFIDTAWQSWWGWTRRLTGALQRLLKKQATTIPDVPVALALAPTEEDTHGHD